MIKLTRSSEGIFLPSRYTSIYDYTHSFPEKLFNSNHYTGFRIELP